MSYIRSHEPAKIANFPEFVNTSFESGPKKLSEPEK